MRSVFSDKEGWKSVRTIYETVPLVLSYSFIELRAAANTHGKGWCPRKKGHPKTNHRAAACREATTPGSTSRALLHVLVAVNCLPYFVTGHGLVVSRDYLLAFSVFASSQCPARREPSGPRYLWHLPRQLVLSYGNSHTLNMGMPAGCGPEVPRARGHLTRNLHHRVALLFVGTQGEHHLLIPTWETIARLGCKMAKFLVVWITLPASECGKRGGCGDLCHKDINNPRFHGICFPSSSRPPVESARSASYKRFPPQIGGQRTKTTSRSIQPHG